MPDNWSGFYELLLSPEPAGDGQRRHTEAKLRHAIRSRRLSAGQRLPSTRDLARQLGVARGTVTSAYQQLIAEGYLIARPGAGTFVAAAGTSLPGPDKPVSARRRLTFDLSTGIPSLSDFPRSAWLAATKHALSVLPGSAFAYPQAAGLPALRSEVAAYLRRVRAVSAQARNVVVTHGASEALVLLTRRLTAQGLRQIAVENPCYPGQVELLSAHGMQPVPIPVDEFGIRVDALERTDCRAVVVTSAHQYPLGVALDPQRRHALLAWASRHNGLIIEDDYDAEHRYDRPGLGALQALDPHLVAYVGTVSKTLAPGLRLGWLVAPPQLRETLIEDKRLYNRGGSVIEHETFAQLLRTGGYDRHLRRTRRLYRQRRDSLLAALARWLPSWRPTGIAAGLHLVVRLPDGDCDTAVTNRLAEAGIKVSRLSGYSAGLPAPFPGLVIGYAATPPDRLHAAVKAMRDVYESSP